MTEATSSEVNAGVVGVEKFNSFLAAEFDVDLVVRLRFRLGEGVTCVGTAILVAERTVVGGANDFVVAELLNLVETMMVAAGPTNLSWKCTVGNDESDGRTNA